jgi:HlyD family secretion protein
LSRPQRGQPGENYDSGRNDDQTDELPASDRPKHADAKSAEEGKAEDVGAASAAAERGPAAPDPRGAPKVARTPAIIVTIVVCAVVGMSLWYLVQPQPLIIQGEADATRIDIAARVDGRVGQRPVERGNNVTAGQLLFQIDNPELVAKLHEAQAGLNLASAQLANIQAGTRVEVIAQRKAAVGSAAANLTLAQRTYDRVKELAGSGNAPIQRLDKTRIRFRSRSAPWTRQSQPMTRR